MITFKQKGDFSKLKKFLEKAKETSKMGFLDRYGKEGVEALSAATPVDTGKTASSWKYEIIRKKDSIEIVWKNTNIQNGVPIAVILQYGHAAKKRWLGAGQGLYQPCNSPDIR